MTEEERGRSEHSEVRRPRPPPRFNPREIPRVGSRTPIRFGTGVEQVFRRSLPEYRQIFWEVTQQYLLCGYRRPPRESYYTFLMVQGARFAGRLCCEVGLNRSPEYPYYRLSDRPSLAVGGIRERVPVLLTGRDVSTPYLSQEQLMQVLYEEVVQQAGRALYTLTEKAMPLLNREFATWHPLYEEWVEAEDDASRPLGERYPALSSEEHTYERIQDFLLGGRFDRLLGPLKFRFREPRFYGCCLYLTCRALEFLEPPPLPPPDAPEESRDLPGEERQPARPRMITWRDILGPPPEEQEEERERAREEERQAREAPEPLGDGIAGILGRQPQPVALELSADPEARREEFAFLKSVAAVEAFYTGQEFE